MATTDRRGVSVDATDSSIAGDPNPGLAIKAPVVCATTGNIALSGLQTIDGIALTAGDRVLVKNQSDATQNGLYNASTGAWARTVDARSNDQLARGTQVLVTRGAVSGLSVWEITSAEPIAIGTTALTFASAFIPGTRNLNTTAPIAGGGSLSSDRTLSLNANGITYGLIQQVAALRILGNPTGALANASEISLGATLAFSGSALQTAAHTGDVTTPANSFATTVAKIAGTTVLGTTGSDNVVFSNGPTVTNPVISGAAPSVAGALGYSLGLLSWYDGSAVQRAVSLDAVQTVTNKTINAANNTISNLATSMFAANVVDTDATLAANSNTRLPSQAAIKSYVDNIATGLAWKAAVAVATTASITLSGEQTIDGVLTSASRVLVKNQATASQNGIYVSAAGAWTRASDMDAAAEFPSAAVFVRGGTVNADTQWTCTNDSVTVGSTSVTFAQVSGAGTYSAGTGLTLTGNQFAIDSTVATLAGVQELTSKTLNASVAKGSWTASGTWTLPAHTLGGAISGGGNQINNVVIGASSPLAGTFTAITGTSVTIATSLAGDVVAQVQNTSANAAATARLKLTSDAGSAQFVAASAAGGAAFNWTWDGSGATQFIAQNASGLFIFYTGAAPAEKVRINNSGGVGVGTSSDPGAGMIYTNAATFMNRSKTSWNNGAAAAAGTLTNAPSAGNPTKWIPVDDNGTTRYIPAW